MDTDVYDIDDPRLIKAAEESGLAAEHAGNPKLLRFYMKKLLIRGWAGASGPEEKRYVALAKKAYGKGPSEAQLAHFATIGKLRP